MCLSSFAQAQSDTIALQELSFDELFDVEVTVATRNALTLKDAPSTVTVFTRNQIDSLGVEDVYSLLNFVPGFQVTRGDWVGAVPKEHSRGVYLDNGYVLFMINGERLNEMSFGKASVYTPFINLDVVERVEIIRGPGSAIYGSNAFMGVVNVITRKKESWVSLGIGENSAQQLSAGWNWQGSNSRLQFIGDWREGDGNPYLYQGVNTSDPFEHVFAQLTYAIDTFEVSTRWTRSELDEFINLGGVNSHNFHQSENISLSAKYSQALSDTTEVKLKGFFIEHEIRSAGNVLSADSVNFISQDFLTGPFWITDELEVEAIVSNRLADDHTIDVGMSYRNAEQTQAGTVTNYLNPATSDIALEDIYYLGRPISFGNQGVNARSPLLSTQKTSSVFAQYAFKVNERLSGYLGARYDDVDVIASNFSPRFALNYQVDATNNIKFQYGQAFRTPVTNELFSEDLVTIGNPNLKPEEIATTELVWLNQTENNRFELIYFHNELDGFVNKLPLSDSLTQFTFQNDIDKHISGAEFAGVTKLTENSQLQLGFTQIFDEPINPSYRRFGYLSLDGNLHNFSLGISANWRDQLNVNQDFKHGSYYLVNVKLAYRLSEKGQLTFTSQNLFDKEFNVYEPRLSNFAIPGKGRESWVGYDYRF